MGKNGLADARSLQERLVMKIGFSHDWLNGMRGGEKCLEALGQVYPDSPIHTLFCDETKISPDIRRHPIINSGRLSWLPALKRTYRYYLPFFPWAAQGFDLSGCEVVLSLSHCVAKGFRNKKGSVHICYCFTPMRYAWAKFDDYFGNKPLLMRFFIQSIIQGLKQWDLESNKSVDHFVAISHHVKDRIRRYYNRDAEVIYPPVDTEFYTPEPRAQREDYYLIVSALVPYKRVDLAVEAFNKNGKTLVIIGDGPDKKILEKKSKKNIQYLSWRSDEVLRDHYRRARALIFPGEEDFGIVPLEMQSCGGTVIAYGMGGALETVLPDKTGVLFETQDCPSLAKAIEKFETMKFDPDDARRYALGFNRRRFQDQMKEMIERVFKEKTIGHATA